MLVSTTTSTSPVDPDPAARRLALALAAAGGGLGPALGPVLRDVAVHVAVVALGLAPHPALPPRPAAETTQVTGLSSPVTSSCAHLWSHWSGAGAGAGLHLVTSTGLHTGLSTIRQSRSVLGSPQPGPHSRTWTRRYLSHFTLAAASPAPGDTPAPAAAPPPCSRAPGPPCWGRPGPAARSPPPPAASW